MSDQKHPAVQAHEQAASHHNEAADRHIQAAQAHERGDHATAQTHADAAHDMGRVAVDAGGNAKQVSQQTK